MYFERVREWKENVCIFDIDILIYTCMCWDKCYVYMYFAWESERRMYVFLIGIFEFTHVCVEKNVMYVCILREGERRMYAFLI